MLHTLLFGMSKQLIVQSLINCLDRHESILEDNIIQDTTFDYFHVRKDIYNAISSSDSIVEKDPELLANAHHFEGRSFCITSPFWQGCVRIQVNSSQTRR